MNLSFITIINIFNNLKAIDGDMTKQQAYEAVNDAVREPNTVGMAMPTPIQVTSCVDLYRACCTDLLHLDTYAVLALS